MRAGVWTLVAVVAIGLILAAGDLLSKQPLSTSHSSRLVGDGKTQSLDNRGVPELSGTLQLQNSAGRSGSFYLPAHAGDEKLPILVVIHGTGRSGRDAVNLFRAMAREYRFALIGPDSRVSPHGEWTWQVGERLGDVTPDLVHIVGCLDEVARLHADRLDIQNVLIAGHSGGGSSAPYVATNSEPFSAFAVLHGGVFPGGLGRRTVRGWFSTGTQDAMRPPSMVRQATSDAANSGLSDLIYREFPGGHGVSPAEQRALVTWWLGSSSPPAQH